MKIFLEHQIVFILKEAEAASLSKNFTVDMHNVCRIKLTFLAPVGNDK